MQVMFLIIIFVILPLISDAEVKEFDLNKGRFELSNGSGNINVSGYKGDKVIVDFNKVRSSKNCEVVFNNQKEKLKIAVKSKSSWFFQNSCRVDFAIKLPERVNTKISSGSGDMSLNSLKGNVGFKVGSGDVAIRDSHLNRLKGKSGSGDISLNGSFADIEIKVGSGDISAALDKVSKSTNLIAKSGSGDVSVKVPKTTHVNVDYKSGSGNLKNKTSKGKEGSVNLKVRTGSGDLNIAEF